MWFYGSLNVNLLVSQDVLEVMSVDSVLQEGHVVIKDVLRVVLAGSGAV